jgi:very-short-patch-repair endonuclease
LDFEQQQYDLERTKQLEFLDIKVFRFENKLVFENLAEVLNEIASNFKSI